MIKQKIKNYINNNIAVCGSLLFFFLLFLYGIVNNMSMSYMGNTSKQVVDFVISNFLGEIVFFIFRILFVYLSIGLAAGIVFHLAVKSYMFLFKTRITKVQGFILNFGLAAFVFFMTFFKDIILYPQVYMNNFYTKNSMNKFIVEFLTDNINPVLFTVIQIIVILAIIAITAAALFTFKKKLFYTSGSVAVLLLILYFALNIFNSSSPVKSDKPNILILASDALRPDHFSGYGYSRDTTPNIDKLIAQGVSFTNAYIEVPRTFPSWVSILTGQFASTHGIRHMFPTSRDLNRDFKSIAKILKDNGYVTSVVADYAGDIFSRIDLGFDSVDTPYFNADSLVQQVIIEAHTFLLPFITNQTGLKIFPVMKDSAYFCPSKFVSSRVINAIKSSWHKPFFITTFLSSTHFPYSCPYPYYKFYADKEYEGPYKYFKQRIVSIDENKAEILNDKDIKQVRALYDGGLKEFDDEAGKIIEFLKDNEILDNTIIIVLSDHGENLYEDGLGMGHGEHFRGKFATKIPLIIRHGNIMPERKINQVVKHVDIAPTILGLLKIDAPSYMEGVSLLPMINGKPDNLAAFGETGIWFDNIIREDLFFQKLRIMYPDIATLSQVDFYFNKEIVLNDDYRDIVNFSKHRYVFDGRYKLIYMPLIDGVRYEMYDTVNDPDESVNIADRDKNNFYRLRNMLFTWMNRNGDIVIRKDYAYPVLRY